jgi:hypothetical protein
LNLPRSRFLPDELRLPLGQSPGEAKDLVQPLDLPYCFFQVMGQCLFKFLVFCGFGEFGQGLDQLILAL